MLGFVPRANPPLKLKLLPALAHEAGPRATALGLRLSTLLGILVWNDFLNPARALRACPRDPRLVRVALGISLRGPQLRMARARAKAQGLSLNAYLEALLAAHLARPRAPFVLLAAKK